MNSLCEGPIQYHKGSPRSLRDRAPPYDDTYIENRIKTKIKIKIKRDIQVI